jgi:hypothetical protein
LYAQSIVTWIVTLRPSDPRAGSWKTQRPFAVCTSALQRSPFFFLNSHFLAIAPLDPT